MGCLEISVQRLSVAWEAEVLSFKTIDPNALRIGQGIDVTASLICDIPQLRYLEVDKDEIWLTPDNNFNGIVNVRSNVRWYIEILDDATDTSVIDSLSNTTMITNGMKLGNQQEAISLMGNETRIRNDAKIFNS